MINNTYEVPCIAGKIKEKYASEPVYVSVPGSKSITNRALLISALADGESTLNGAMLSGDSRVFIECLKNLGISVDTISETVNDSGDDAGIVSPGNVTLKISGCSRALPSSASLNVGSAGTAARFLTAALGVSQGRYELDSSEQMRKRPMSSLLDTLSSLGCEVSYGQEPGHFPFTLDSHGFKRHEFTVNIDESSQFLSAMLIASVLSDENIVIHITGSHGMSYVEMTRRIMAQFGKSVKIPAGNGPSDYRIPAGAGYNSRSYDIEPDMSAAAYFYAMSALIGIKVCVRGVHFDSMQGDIEFIHVLENMGCSADDTAEGIILTPPADGILHGIDIDMSAFSDQAITLSAIAPFADSPTTIRNIGHIRLQESDRLSGIAAELKRIGVRVEENEDSVTIYPIETGQDGNKPETETESPILIETYNDHRMAMGFSLLGLKIPGIVINDPGCCSKTFENYFEVLDSIIEIIKG
ncbi:MAG: 3-phosphoshikimate 1-carboxyvinyltransferase [Lachnospiraceae bacterium]|nr:3-phosphoshikimate 1-carboxyvinyltransferase [Lachnospiraceae bacterium]